MPGEYVSQRASVTADAAAPYTFPAVSPRAMRYAALSGLLRFPRLSPEEPVRVLLESCPSCPFVGSPAHGEILAAGHRALAWSRSVAEPCSLAVEHVRLFGPVDSDARVACPLSLEVTHTRADAVDTGRRLLDAYREVGYWMGDTEHLPACPGHVSHLLGYMAHCLTLAGYGLPDLEIAGNVFLSTRLQPWALDFAVALRSASTHPVTHFTGLALEQFLRCEFAGHAESAC
ncbi:MAG: hypothetical protein ACYC77_00570 [Coriobacteriia bacterium]